MNVTLKQIRAFVEVARARGFTRAAENCGLSQPALTVAIRQLEDALGTSLFERSTRRVLLSDDGLKFLPTAERLLAEFDGAIREMQSGKAAGRERVSVAALPSFASLVLPGAVAALLADCPEVNVHIRDSNSGSIQRRVRAGEIDFGLGSLWQTDPEIQFEPLLTDRFGVVCRADHDLARSTEPLPLAEITRYPLLGFAMDTGIRPVLDEVEHTLGRRLKPRLELSNIATAGAMLVEGLGVAAIPYMTYACLGNPALVFRPLAEPELNRHIGLLHRTGAPLGPTALRFRRHVLDACAGVAARASLVTAQGPCLQHRRPAPAGPSRTETDHDIPQ